MHPILASVRRLGLYLVLFAQAGLALGELLVWTASMPRALAMLVAVPPMLVLAFACLASWYLCRRLPIGGTPLGRLAANHLAAAVVVAVLISWLGHGWRAIAICTITAFCRMTMDPICARPFCRRWLQSRITTTTTTTGQVMLLPLA